MCRFTLLRYTAKNRRQCHSCQEPIYELVPDTFVSLDLCFLPIAAGAIRVFFSCQRNLIDFAYPIDIERVPFSPLWRARPYNLSVLSEQRSKLVHRDVILHLRFVIDPAKNGDRFVVFNEAVIRDVLVVAVREAPTLDLKLQMNHVGASLKLHKQIRECRPKSDHLVDPK